jgi:hypothetical protein
LASKNVYYLRFRNESRLNKFKRGVGLIGFIGKLFVSVSLSFVMYYFIIMREKDVFDNSLKEVDIKIGPVVIIFLFGFIAS